MRCIANGSVPVRNNFESGVNDVKTVFGLSSSSCCSFAAESMGALVPDPSLIALFLTTTIDVSASLVRVEAEMTRTRHLS